MLDRLEDEMCINYCKYHEQAMTEYKEGAKLPSVCKDCPLMMI